MAEKTCETCQLWAVDELGDGYCCNSDSPFCAEVMAPYRTCGEHQPQLKDTDNG